MWRLLHLCQALGEAVHPVSFEFLFRCFKTNARLPSVVQKPAWNYTPQGGIIPFRGGGGWKSKPNPILKNKDTFSTNPVKFAQGRRLT